MPEASEGAGRREAGEDARGPRRESGRSRLNRSEARAHRDPVMGVIFLLVLVALGLGALGVVLLAVVFLIRISRGKSGIKSGLPPYSHPDDGSWTQPSVFEPAAAAAVPPPIPSDSEAPADPRRHHSHAGHDVSCDPGPVSGSDPGASSESPSASGCSSDSCGSDSGGSSSGSSGSSD